jgi:mannitol-1-phosphate/altronate dehydrogenase
MESIKLNRENLARIPGSVLVPGYDRERLVPSIVHIGLGHFHRAHQAVYLDELLSKGLTPWGIFGMNLIPDSFPLEEILKGQDYLYTLITKDPKGEADVRVVGSIAGYLNAGAGKEAALRRLAEDTTELISLTVTEGGYYYDRAKGEPDPKEAAVRHDLETPEDPKTAAACLAAALARRFKAGRKPLTIMCCDNIPANGKLLKSCVLFHCREHYPEIIPWIEDSVSFPCSMVDRITPGTTPDLVKELEERYGISDRWPVCGEDFRQWVLEDNFKTQVPDYSAAGVRIVKDVEPYELMKMRLLNGSHSALAYPSYLLGCRMVDQGISHPLIGGFIRNHYMEEVSPTLEPVPGIDLKAYKDTLISRFSNKNIGDTLLRLASFGTSKFPNFMLKPLSEAVNKNLPYSSITFAVACWARFLQGNDEQGAAIPIEDMNKEAITAAAQKALADPAAFLKTAGIQNLSGARLAAAAATFRTQLDAICRKGIKGALEEFLGT